MSFWTRDKTGDFVMCPAAANVQKPPENIHLRFGMYAMHAFTRAELQRGNFSVHKGRIDETGLKLMRMSQV
jgi:hypothetical protein